MSRSTTKAPTFTADERALLQATASSVWDEIAYDVLQATADEKGKSINVVTISRPVVIELALDAGRLDEKLDARRRRELARGETSLVTDDLLARWSAADYKQKIATVKPAFAYTRYGL